MVVVAVVSSLVIKVLKRLLDVENGVTYLTVVDKLAAN